MAVPMASLQRAATNPLARTAGTVTTATGIPTASGGGGLSKPGVRYALPPAPPPYQDPDPGGTARRNAENSAATSAAKIAEANALQSAQQTGFVSGAPTAPATVALTPQQRADAEAARLAAARAADYAAGLGPQAEMEAFQARVEAERRQSEALQRQRAALLFPPIGPAQTAQNDSHALAGDQAVFDRSLSRADAAGDREDLFALLEEARARGLLPSNSSSATSSLANAAAAPPPAHITHAPATVNTSAAFSRAKDRVGAIGRSALDSLTRAYSGRGLSGSSIEGRGIGEAVERGAGALSDTARSEAMAEADRMNAVDDQTYQGDLSQRNSDIAAQQEAQRFGLARDAQAQSAQNAGFSNLQGLMALIRRGRPVY